MSMAVQNPMAELTSFKIDCILAAEYVEENGSKRELASEYDEPSGQCISQRLEQTGYDNLNHGRLYPALDDLVERGLVERGQIDRRTNSYTLTEKGRDSLESYREFVGC